MRGFKPARGKSNSFSRNAGFTKIVAASAQNSRDPLTNITAKPAQVHGRSWPATCETGLKITVPAFVSAGEEIVIDTRTGEYLSRAK